MMPDVAAVTTPKPQEEATSTVAPTTLGPDTSTLTIEGMKPEDEGSLILHGERFIFTSKK